MINSESVRGWQKRERDIRAKFHVYIEPFLTQLSSGKPTYTRTASRLASVSPLIGKPYAFKIAS
ncbi:hypothetical protein SERLA73DRAFT_176470 [Serpula lacrymans var. lacrymans S7.3]|uniref:Uncharacterized protein n=1 Tax=Serpula lacrymans var. lacrymans (strain S7.3) TaxID=936435 RepID=F8PN10_SERL3|nr:hypothetical protein SERLA73DRAFT_176470 [Serpula lacrymans var. lacrymans S7.3]